jgi:hypothetical protein
MCDCALLIDRRTGKPVAIQSGAHRLLYNSTELLAGIEMSGVINYAAAHRITNVHGVSRGYMFIIGESK